MATRDRTPAFKLIDLEYNNKTKNHSIADPKDRDHGNDIPLGEKEKDSVQLKLVNFVPAWLQRVNDIDSNICKIKLKIERLEQLQENKVLPTFDDDGESIVKMEIKTLKIIRLIDATNQLVKTLGEGFDLSIEDTRMKKDIQRSKIATMQTVSLLFKQNQNNYLTKISLEMALPTWNEIQDIKAGDVPPSISLTNQQMNLVNGIVCDVHARDREIKKVLSSIQDITQLIHDLGLLVGQQDSVLDQIEYNLDHAEGSTIGGDTMYMYYICSFYRNHNDNVNHINKTNES
ncbi:hypothetical protein CYY_003181 [Polysphondylium violaceum]|uniref:t-SNARE coiled-coil homology domain-containing protein n=1 Tax=Polysphondylium violaceum TaxID=133409 RepID=A0A8J4V0E4_9MYCE|nr:hypothetical protein CYY_003181 [Polysphondylium violaceum]